MDLQLEKFEGPLDLLLHLIKTNKIDIYDIPISELTVQYIDYLKKMEQLNMDIASEFIVMASELLYIKSKMLLPNENKENTDEADDPRLGLVEKLLDYQKYAEISGYLKARQQIGINSFTKHREKIKGLIRYSKIEMEKQSLLDTLDSLYERLEERVLPSRDSFSGIVEREVVSVAKMEGLLKSEVFSKKCVGLVSLFSELCKTRAQLAAAFMAMLDMIKNNTLIIENKNNEFFLRKGEIE